MLVGQPPPPCCSSRSRQPNSAISATCLYPPVNEHGNGKFMKMVVVGLIVFWGVHYINLPRCHSPNPHSKGQTGHPRPPFQCHAILLRNGIRSKPINPIKTPVSVKCLTETKEKFTSHQWAFHLLFYKQSRTHTHTHFTPDFESETSRTQSYRIFECLIGNPNRFKDWNLSETAGFNLNQQKGRRGGSL